MLREDRDTGEGTTCESVRLPMLCDIQGLVTAPDNARTGIATCCINGKNATISGIFPCLVFVTNTVNVDVLRNFDSLHERISQQYLYFTLFFKLKTNGTFVLSRSCAIKAFSIPLIIK